MWLKYRKIDTGYCETGQTKHRIKLWWLYGLHNALHHLLRFKPREQHLEQHANVMLFQNATLSRLFYLFWIYTCVLLFDVLNGCSSSIREQHLEQQHANVMLFQNATLSSLFYLFWIYTCVLLFDILNGCSSSIREQHVEQHASERHVVPECDFE